MDESANSQDVSEEAPSERNVQVKCSVCERGLIVDGKVEAMPLMVRERFRPVGGRILNAAGQQQVEIPFICPDKPKCYRDVLADESWKKADAAINPQVMPVKGQLQRN